MSVSVEMCVYFNAVTFDCCFYAAVVHEAELQARCSLALCVLGVVLK